MKICPYCNAKIPDEAEYCPECLNYFDEGPEPVHVPDEPAAPAGRRASARSAAAASRDEDYPEEAPRTSAPRKAAPKAAAPKPAQTRNAAPRRREADPDDGWEDAAAAAKRARRSRKKKNDLRNLIIMAAALIIVIAIIVAAVSGKGKKNREEAERSAAVSVQSAAAVSAVSAEAPETESQAESTSAVSTSSEEQAASAETPAETQEFTDDGIPIEEFIDASEFTDDGIPIEEYVEDSGNAEQTAQEQTAPAAPLGEDASAETRTGLTLYENPDVKTDLRNALQDLPYMYSLMGDNPETAKDSQGFTTYTYGNVAFRADPEGNIRNITVKYDSTSGSFDYGFFGFCGATTQTEVMGLMGVPDGGSGSKAVYAFNGRDEKPELAITYSADGHISMMEYSMVL